jgi:hypothetical protein
VAEKLICDIQCEPVNKRNAQQRRRIAEGYFPVGEGAALGTWLAICERRWLGARILPLLLVVAAWSMYWLAAAVTFFELTTRSSFMVYSLHGAGYQLALFVYTVMITSPFVLPPFIFAATVSHGQALRFPQELVAAVPGNELWHAVAGRVDRRALLWILLGCALPLLTNLLYLALQYLAMPPAAQGQPGALKWFAVVALTVVTACICLSQTARYIALRHSRSNLLVAGLVGLSILWLPPAVTMLQATNDLDSEQVSRWPLLVLCSVYLGFAGLLAHETRRIRDTEAALFLDPTAR